VNAAGITKATLFMKLGFICVNGQGHINPMTALARQLQARNHEVVFLYSPEAAGLPCVPGPENDQFQAKKAEVSKMRVMTPWNFRWGSSWLRPR